MSGFGSTPAAFRQAQNFCQIDCGVEGRCSEVRSQEKLRQKKCKISTSNIPHNTLSKDSKMLRTLLKVFYLIKFFSFIFLKMSSLVRLSMTALSKAQSSNKPFTKQIGPILKSKTALLNVFAKFVAQWIRSLLRSSRIVWTNARRSYKTYSGNNKTIIFLSS